jgi:hypothetical protein
MMFTATVRIDLSLILSKTGIDVYVGDEETPSNEYTLTDLTDDFLDNYCDENGKVYEELTHDLDSLLAQFKACVKMLEDAK